MAAPVMSSAQVRNENSSLLGGKGGKVKGISVGDTASIKSDSSVFEREDVAQEVKQVKG